MSQNLTHTGKRFDLLDPNAKTSLDAQETKSLCCAAAGITAPSSSTTEARIPHEKLRVAALVGATPNAQERLLAQPVVGYKPPPNDQESMQQPVFNVAQIDEQAEFEREFPLDTQLISSNSLMDEQEVAA